MIKEIIKPRIIQTMKNIRIYSIFQPVNLKMKMLFHKIMLIIIYNKQRSKSKINTLINLSLILTISTIITINTYLIITMVRSLRIMNLL
jgi:hypothetical protein